MNATDAVRLCRLVRALCPSQQMDTYTPDAWSALLGGYDYADAKQAVLEICALPLEPGRSRYVEPGHIIATIHGTRRKRLAEVSMPTPPSGLDAAGYVDWMRDQRAQIAAGYTPAPDPKHPLEPGRVRELLAAATPKETLP